MLKQKDGFNGERTLVVPKLIVERMEQDPLVSMLHITDIGYYPKAANHFRKRTKPIDQYVYIYCVNGEGWYRVNNREYHVGTNQYFILPAGVPHAYGSDDKNPWTIYWIHFKGELAQHYAKDALEPMDVKPCPKSRISNRIDMFEDIFNTLRSGYSNENLRYVSSLFHYYLGTLRYINQYREASSNHVEDDNIVEVIIHYMKENIEKHITLQDISGYLGYSPSHSSMVFKKKTGHSPLAYFNLLKIQQACQLLDTTDMKVKQICYKIGIEDAYYFSRLFSKTMGMSPKEYRELKKG
jgi:AraC family transcriptional regulator of arabinose operon